MHNLLLFFPKNIPHVTEALQLLLKWHPYLHHNKKDSLVIETGAVEQTQLKWLETTINYLHHL